MIKQRATRAALPISSTVEQCLSKATPATGELSEQVLSGKGEKDDGSRLQRAE